MVKKKSRVLGKRSGRSTIIQKGRPFMINIRRGGESNR